MVWKSDLRETKVFRIDICTEVLIILKLGGNSSDMMRR